MSAAVRQARARFVRDYAYQVDLQAKMAAQEDLVDRLYNAIPDAEREAEVDGEGKEERVAAFNRVVAEHDRALATAERMRLRHDVVSDHVAKSRAALIDATAAFLRSLPHEQLLKHIALPEENQS